MPETTDEKVQACLQTYIDLTRNIPAVLLQVVLFWRMRKGSGMFNATARDYTTLVQLETEAVAAGAGSTNRLQENPVNERATRASASGIHQFTTVCLRRFGRLHCSIGSGS